ncbi:hypothetical protein WICMUC_000709 [Wickerhamomyces mucosus]|uniref:Lethal giant larvae (Lgl)-like C-terminal domain-containing protein n=1 Tax=Wickerhamomyces mucosus TaxID=1378264 RepID=A0A9P8TIE4_9ASCO|nr:hypothetical protein WICMUC_000709 [Wickerhamomyces mucosus]
MFKRNKHLKSVSNAIKSITGYGFAGKLTGSAFDPVQSLLAISTDNGEIHVFGQQQVEVILKSGSTTPIRHLRFVKGVYLVAIDDKSTVIVFSLLSKKALYTISPPGIVTSFETDPSLDWLLLGLQSGIIVCYDIDRGVFTDFRIGCLQRDVLPSSKSTKVVSIQWSPRDLGTILIAYEDCAVIFSISSGELKQKFHYEVPAGAAGGDGIPINQPRYPKLLQALYHPNSLNILTTHEDGSLVFWDALTGKLLQARSLFDTDVNQPQGFSANASGLRNTRFLKASWICGKDPEETSLLIAGGDTVESEGIHNLTLFHFGNTPKYSLSSYDYMSKHYAKPKQQRFLPINNPSNIVDFLPLGQSSPYFGGNHNPNYIVTLLESGEIETLSYPNAILEYRSNFFPQSIAWAHPATTVSVTTPVPRKQWLGMIAKSSRNSNILKGGFPHQKQIKAHEIRSALLTGHTNGSVRLWDASKGELEESSVIDVNVAATLNSYKNISIDNISYAGDTAELTVSTIDGDVVLYKYDINKNYNPETGIESSFGRLSLQQEKSLLVNLAHRTPNIKEGFMPIVCFHAKKGRVSAIKNSNIGFVAVAYDSGDLIIIDRRGPAIIFSDNILKDTAKNSQLLTAFEFSIMTYGDDNYSSILLFAGSDQGELFIFKILPESSGRFTAKLVDINSVSDSSIKTIHPFKQKTGTPNIANLQDFGQLSQGIVIESSILVTSLHDLRILTPGKSKSTSKPFREEIYASGLSIIGVHNSSSDKSYGTVVPVLLSDESIRILSLPELKEIVPLRLESSIDRSFGKYSSVLPSGDVAVRISENHAKLINIVGTNITHSDDILFNDRKSIPSRPNIGTVQWFKGSPIINNNDLDRIISGDRRAKPKTVESEYASKILINRPLSSHLSPSSSSSPNLNSDEFSYAKPVRKRTQGGYDPTKYVIRSFQNGIESVEESFNEYANNASQSMNESISQAKTDLVKGIVKSKFGF